LEDSFLLDEILSLTATVQTQQQGTKPSAKRKADAQAGNKASIQTKRQQLKQQALRAEDDLHPEPVPGMTCASTLSCFS
jgi:hypothetical protein